MNNLVLALLLCLTGCTGLPENVTPVSDFKLEKYLGTWYEIARLDHSFERGLTRVTAAYSLRDDGGVRVLNRGYSARDSEWKEAEGKAYFVKQSDLGYLKVSFFGPFYGSYVVLALDREGYQYSLVSGPPVASAMEAVMTPSRKALALLALGMLLGAACPGGPLIMVDGFAANEFAAIAGREHATEICPCSASRTTAASSLPSSYFS